MKTQKNVLGLISRIDFYFLSSGTDVQCNNISIQAPFCFTEKFFKEKGISKFNLASLCHRQEL